MSADLNAERVRMSPKGKEASPMTDSPEQARVIASPIDADALVVAGAGSGKTYTMTRRIITLIEQGAAPERILGLTFTRKAAAELLSRVSRAVLDHDAGTAGSAGPSRGVERRSVSDASPAMASHAFLKPEVLTYDAFFQSIVRQYGLLVGFDQNTQPLSEAGARQLASDAVEAHMDLLGDQDFGAFSTVVDDVLHLSNAISGSMIGPACGTVGEAIERVRDWDGAMLRCLDRGIGGQSVPESSPKLSTGAVKRRKSDDDARYARRVAEAREILLQKRHDASLFNAAKLRDTIRQREVLLTLVAEYDAYKQRLGMAEFSDFTLAAYRLVTRFEAIGDRYRRRYGHVLLDEYQDTSTTQATVIATIFHPCLDGRQDGSRASRTRSAVTAVGDPFQSIYAWRGASPGAFRIFQRDFAMDENTRPYSLSVTRRNARIILDAANDLTAPLRHGNAPRIASSSAMHEVEAEPLSAMDDAPLGTLGMLGYDTLGQEIDGVARFARTCIRRHEEDRGRAQEGGGDHQDGHRPVVAVLFRSKANMPLFAEGLERAGLSTVTVGYSALLERPEIKDVLALLHVVVDHSDVSSLMRLLATPRYAISAASLRVLSALANEDNAEFQFRALVQAGIVDRHIPRSRHAATVAQHRDDVTNGVFLVDVLTRPDLPQVLARQEAITPGQRHAVLRAAGAIRQVHAVMHRTLDAVVRAAIEALDIDIDTVVARAVNQGAILSPSLAHAPADALVDLIATYTSEMAAGQRPSLRGFVAWIDALSTLEETTTSMPEGDADVVLMTIHQSKGLEWDAVAVVGMQQRAFPSAIGDSLNVEPDDRHPGAMRGGVWNPPEYHERAATWLHRRNEVPVPTRADAAILPKFPHNASLRVDADADAETRWSLGDFETGGSNAMDPMDPMDPMNRLNAEIDGDDVRVFDERNGIEDADGVDHGESFLCQREEYGRRLHADERRLAYVALTRARTEAMMSYHCSNSLLRDATNEQVKTTKDAPSNFWQEVHDAMSGREDAVRPSALGTPATQMSVGQLEAVGIETGRSGQGESLLSLESPLPRGLFVGSDAAEYMRDVVDQAWSRPFDERDDGTPLPWPIALTPRMTNALQVSARTVRAAIRRENRPAQSDAVPPAQSGSPSLRLSAAMLVDDDYLMPWSVSGAGDAQRGLGAVVRARGTRILSRQRHTVTAVQARSGLMDTHQEQEYWMGLVRPIPRAVSPSAQAGTRFHAWAERFVNAFDDGFGGPFGDDTRAWPDDTLTDDLSQAVATGAPVETRAAMIAALGEAEAALRMRGVRRDTDATPAQERELLRWERRLTQSRWAKRRPKGAERQIVMAMSPLGGQIVVGKLDAIFYGGVDDATSTDYRRYTIVDWKTGVKPRGDRDIAVKLQQLDMYRLLLAAMDNIPLADIDATLYYLNEPDEGDRELRARGKTTEEIVAELSSGIPSSSDND